MAGLDPATQRARVCGRKEVHAEDAENAEKKKTRALRVSA
jgi:hypothetical protein